MRVTHSMAALVLASCLGTLAVPSPAAELKPYTYSALFSRAKLVVAGTVENVSLGLLSDGRKARVRIEGLFKGRIPVRDIDVAWKDEDHKETCYADGARVVLFLIMREDSVYAQAAPGVSCWTVEKEAFGSGKPVRAVSYEFPLDLVTGIPKGAMRETKVVEKSRDFQVPKRKKWILVDALLPSLKPWRPSRAARKRPAN